MKLQPQMLDAILFAGFLLGFFILVLILRRVSVNYWTSFNRSVDSELNRAFVFVSPARLFVANVILSLMVALVVWTVMGSPWPAIVIALLCSALPRVVMRKLRSRRAEQFRQQLPEAISVLAGGLRAGSSLSGALSEVANQMPAPVSQEISLALRQSRMGSTLDDAMRSLEKRLPTEETTLMVGALRIGAHAGGNVASTLDALSDAMRTKLVLEAKIRALTAQGKLQAWVMGLLPFVVLGAMLLIDPALSEAYFGSVLGWSVLGLVAVLQVVGGLLIRHTVNIQI